mgnify:CR=1 FL=1
MVSLGEVCRQVRKNMPQFHMGESTEMKSAESKLVPNHNTAFHLHNWAGVFISRIFILPSYDH